jgi:hypothetical protein
VCATPSGTELCVAADGVVYRIDVQRPAEGLRAVHWDVNQIVPVQGLALLLIVRATDIVAVGRQGIAWTSHPLVADDLQVVTATRDAIVCMGELDNDQLSMLEVDPVSGHQVSGPRVRRPARPDPFA